MEGNKVTLRCEKAPTECTCGGKSCNKTIKTKKNENRKAITAYELSLTK